MAKVLDSAGVQELWTTIKIRLALKVDKTELSNYATDLDVEQAINIALLDYMTKNETNEAIIEALGKIVGVSFKKVDTLPEAGESNVIYLVPSKDPSEQNEKDEYMWLDDKWELIGSTSISLSDYWSKDELQAISHEELKEILQ